LTKEISLPVGWYTKCSLVEGEHPVGEAKPERDNTIDSPVSSVVFVDPFQEVLMGAIAEGSIS
jgi:hypothetical protein